MSWNNNYGQQQQGGWGQQPPPQQNWGGAPPQQGGYGAPPPQQQQWGQQQPPQGQYGAPPQQQQWGGQPPAQQWGGQQQPPQQQWGGAPPQQGYGAPPPQQGYGGAPPPQQGGYGGAPTYGQAPPGQQYGQNYGAPQPAFNQSPGGPRFLGVQIPAPPPAPPIANLPSYNPQFDADRIRKATKGIGTDERTLIDTLVPLDAFQIDVLSRTFEQTVGRSLQKTLEKELSGWFEFVLLLLSRGPLGGDIALLHRACDGAGTHEDLLTEILIGRTNEEIFLLKEGYRRVYNKDLVSVIKGELSMKTERMFVMALTGSRDESPHVNPQQVQQDVEALYRAGPGKAGTDEIAICGILLQRSDAHLQAIAQAFPTRHRISLSHMVEKEFSGHMKEALLHVAQGAENDGQGVFRDVQYLEAAMSGMGTKDERLSYRIVRYHWNRPRFGAIKNQYQQRYRKSLRSRVEGETSGKYEKALVGIIEQN
ncbi:Annexin C1 [Vanrija albida]|uniref:Annexin n=1 Tax=Vanrija albida TaxID=181172 RepID=A0ABR3PYH1_9TREE